MKTTFTYKSRFAKILEVQVLHEFYTNRIYKDVTFSPTPQTAALIRNYKILFRTVSNGFVLLYNRNANSDSAAFSEPLDLQIEMEFKDKLFINYTKVPFRYNQMFSFKNSINNSNLLHEQNYVTETAIQESEKAGVVGLIDLTINTNNEIFGISETAKKIESQSYLINFDSREVVVRYNFYFTTADADFSNYFIVDSKNQNKLEGYSERILANGMNVYTMELPETLKLKQRYSEVYYLKKEDEFYKSFSKSLPQPNNQSLSYDETRDVFVADIFMKLD